MLHSYMKKEKYVKNEIAIKFIHVFLIFCVAKSIKSMQHGYSLNEELNHASNKFSGSKFE